MLEQTKVVVVDDESTIVEIVCEALGDEGIAAVSCGYGSRALRCIYRHQPSLVVLDVQMPETDGIEIFQHMRSQPQTTATPVIFLTANSHLVSQRVPNYDEQNAALLPKPFDLVAFLDLVQGFLGHT